MIDDASDTILRMPECDRIGIFGDGQCSWCVELEVDIAPRNRYIRERMPFSAGGVGVLGAGRYILIACYPSFMDEPSDVCYFKDDDVKPLLMERLDYITIASFADEKLAHISFTSTANEPAGNAEAFHDATRDWLVDMGDIDWY